MARNRRRKQQQEENPQQEGSISFLGGLNKDNSLVTQPSGTTTFVLNGVNETKEGDLGFRSSEESNEKSYQLPLGTTPIGKVHIGEGNILLFLADNKGNSYLAIADERDNLNVIVSDAGQTEKFGFKTSQQIDATFRLRRGCERVVYWVDPKPRMYIIDKEEEFKRPNGEWDVSKFGLFKRYKTIPNFDTIKVTDGGGDLAPGSYSFAIQYLDEDFNPTEFVTSSEPVRIYNSSLSATYREIRGATTEVNAYQDFGKSNKAIELKFSNLDSTFPFYRIAITEATSGSGSISDTKYTSEISTLDNTFIYTGNNYESIGSQEEVHMFNNIIEKAGHIEQLENILILGETEGKQVDFCKLQNYASRINADMITKEVDLTSLSSANPKSPTGSFEGFGYMPGEIYSFGIVYIFKDNSLSPVYHIPGRNSSVPTNHKYTSGANVYPMSSFENKAQDTLYTDNNSCSSGDYWGKDSSGLKLKNTPIRHHRFPLRTDVGIPMIQSQTSSSFNQNARRLNIRYEGTLSVPRECSPIGSPDYNANCVPTYVPPFEVVITYTADGVQGREYSFTVNPDTWAKGFEEPGSLSYNVNITLNTAALGNSIIIENIKEVSSDTVILQGQAMSGLTYNTTVFSPKGLKYFINIEEASESLSTETTTSKVFGIRFSNIQMPSLADTNGEEVIGYYIVRNDRKEEDRTIVDSVILTPTVKHKKFIGAGLLMPEPISANKPELKKDIYSMINPEFKFNNKKHTNFDKLIQQGKFDKKDLIRSRTKINDVMDGSGYVDGKHKKGEKDDDGFNIQIKTRDNFFNYSNQLGFNIPFSKVKDVFYLNALEDKIILDSQDAMADVFNLACDNKTGIISFRESYPLTSNTTLPYAYIYRSNANPYSNFRTTTYYKDSKNPHYFSGQTSTCDIFGGDSYITPIKYTNSIFYDNRMKQRAGKTSAWNYIIATVLVAAAVLVTVFSGGLGFASISGALAVSASLAGGATALVASGLKQAAWSRAYERLYKEGLRETVEDNYMLHDKDLITGHYRGFKKNPCDDEIQWLGESINVWMESAVNMALRNGATDNTPDFVNAPAPIESGTTEPEGEHNYFDIRSVTSGKFKDVEPTTSLDTHMLKKLTVLDSNRKSGRLYLGVALAEIYKINPDYNLENTQKGYNHLGIEYDCCSDCREEFPHRIFYSVQSFQEELTDNFRMFLPNNYKDIEGDTGRITDIFRIQSNLFIHTESALWHLPQNLQERITNDILSFVGTGEYFNIPPRKIVDDTNSSAGTTHKWGRIKTKHGVLFPSHKEKKWYLFNGQNLEPISDSGMSKEFKRIMEFKAGDNYAYDDNPSNILGVGYISVYDTNKERFIVTKKDFEITNINDDQELCSEGKEVLVFDNVPAIISQKASEGFIYVGFENCRMKFERSVTINGNITTEVIYIDGEEFTPTFRNHSTTISYSLKEKQWTSYHSYLPSFYLQAQERFYSWPQGGSHLWKHNKQGEYLRFYGRVAPYPFIVEYVDNVSPLTTKLWDAVLFQSEAKRYDSQVGDYIDVADVTFNKAVLYNTYQTSGLLNLATKRDVHADYLLDQTKNSVSTLNSIILERTERDWSINDLRDLRIDNTTPMFIKNIDASVIQSNYYIDKVINPAAIDYNKDWTQMESFRDKFLVVRLIFDKFADTRLIFNFSNLDRKASER